MTKLTVAFRNVARAPNNVCCHLSLGGWINLIVKYSQCKFSQNTTNLLSIKVATLIDNKLVVFWLYLLLEYLLKTHRDGSNKNLFVDLSELLALYRPIVCTLIWTPNYLACDRFKIHNTEYHVPPQEPDYANVLTLLVILAPLTTWPVSDMNNSYALHWMTITKYVYF